jgi:integrase
LFTANSAKKDYICCKLFYKCFTKNMATFKAIVRPHQKKKDGTCNVKIRVTHKRVLRDVPTNIFVGTEDVTRTTLKIKNQQYIDQLDEIVKQCRKRCNENATILGDMDVDEVVRLVKDIIKGEKKGADRYFDFDFIQYGRQYAQKMRDAARKGNASMYETALNNLVKFVERESISIHEITAKFIGNWIDWIQKNTKGGRAASLYASVIRALHNRAKEEYNDEDIGLVRIPLSPFKKVKLPRMPARRERALSAEQIRKIFALKDEPEHNNGNNRFNFARDMFMLSFGLVGMNSADLYNCTDYKNGRITYKRKKVTNRRADGAKISIKVEPEIQPLVDKYRDTTGKRVFKFYKMYRDENTLSAAINGKRRANKKGEVLSVGLKKIGDLIGEPDLEFYAARHSWASIAQNDVGIDKYTVHVALNHVIEEMKVTDIYTKKDWGVIDRANRKVLDFVTSEESRR